MDITHCSHPLPHGITLHSRVSGPVDGPLLLLLHGFPEAAFVWDDLLRLTVVSICTVPAP